MRTAFKVPIANASLDKKQLHSPSNQPAVESAADNVGSSGSVDPAILSPTDMPGDMLTFATEIAIKAFTSFTSVADMAEYLRMKFEARFPSMATGNWQTSVGSNFASSVGSFNLQPSGSRSCNKKHLFQIRKRTGTGFYAKLKNTYFLIYASP
jgi:Dynein light chain type 1